MWESFGGSSSQSQNSGQNYSNYVNGRYRDRFTLGESQHGEEYLIHSNKYLANRKSSSSVYKIETGLPTFSVAWHPSRPILAYWFWGFGSVFFSKNNSFLICFSLNKNSNQTPSHACDESDKEDSRSKSDNCLGNIRLFGIDF